MDIEHNLLCQYCQLAFDTEKEFSLHSCIEIKLEKPDLKVDGSLLNCDSFDLDVSEDFINMILKHVDNLCDIIRNGDPSLERTTEVNENLNSAVSCYRSRLLFIESKHIEMQDDWDNYDNMPQESKMESDKSDSDTKIGNKAKKNRVRKVAKPNFSRPEKPGLPSYLKAKTIDIDDIVLFQYLKFNMQQKKFECQICDKATALRHNAFIHLKLRHKNDLTLKPTQFEPKVDCGDGSCKKLYGLTQRKLWCQQCTSISRIPKDIDAPIKAETKSDIEINPKFKNAKNTRNPDDIFLYPYVKYISETELQCLCCDTYTHRKKAQLFRHLRSVHKTEINWNKEPEKLNDCKTRVCKKLYGFGNKELWCIQCSAIAKIKREESDRISNQKQKNKIKELKLCTECGKNVIDLREHIKTVHENKKRKNRKKEELCTECGNYVNFLKRHMKQVHEFDKQKCPHCDKEQRNAMRLYVHIKQNHSEKLPCKHCGKLLTSWNMKRHVETQHTSNDEKKYKCDVCGKGFARKEHLPDHKNIHTGEKPYKCKFCSACFASRGNHNIHERSHLGYKRKSSK